MPMGVYNLAPSLVATDKKNSTDSEISSNFSDSSSGSSCADLTLPFYRVNSSKSRAKNSTKAPKGPKKPTKHSHKDPLLKDSLLYDTGSTIHIVNSKKWFSGTYEPNRGHLGPIMTGGGPVTPSGRGTAVFEVLVSKNPDKYLKLVLIGAIYLPEIDLSLFSGVKHYAKGGYLSNQTLYGAHKKPIGLLNFQQTGFFMKIKGLTTPRAHFASSEVLIASYSFPMGYSAAHGELVVEIPPLSKEERDKYKLIDLSEDSGSEKSVISGPLQKARDPLAQNLEKLIPGLPVLKQALEGEAPQASERDLLSPDRPCEPKKRSLSWDLEEDRPCRPSESQQNQPTKG